MSLRSKLLNSIISYLPSQGIKQECDRLKIILAFYVKIVNPFNELSAHVTPIRPDKHRYP